jgi:hypothetical protein
MRAMGFARHRLSLESIALSPPEDAFLRENENPNENRPSIWVFFVSRVDWPETPGNAARANSNGCSATHPNLCRERGSGVRHTRARAFASTRILSRASSPTSRQSRLRLFPVRV